MTTFLLENEGMECILPTVFKAMKSKYAEKLITSGDVYFTNIFCYKNDIHPERGDMNEGEEKVIRKGNLCHLSSDTIPTYVWCASLDPRVDILSTWTDCDTIIQILNMKEFLRRIRKSLKMYCENTGTMLGYLRFGSVSYTKTEGGNEDLDWSDNGFQKDTRFISQMEYRLLLQEYIDTPSEVFNKEKIILNIGNCENIVKLHFK